LIVLWNCPACGAEVEVSSPCDCDEQEPGAGQESQKAAKHDTVEVWTRRKRIPTRRRTLARRAREGIEFTDSAAGAVAALIGAVTFLFLVGYESGDPFFYLTWGPVPYLLGLGFLLLLGWRWMDWYARAAHR
jgi:hypothetical protein